MARVLSAAEAATLVPDGATVMITGSGGGLMDADFTYAAIEQRFLTEGHPRDLTLVHVTGIGNRAEQGVSRFAHVGMTRRVIGGHWGWSPEMIRLALEEEIEAYNVPQGVLSVIGREIAAGRKGLITRVGLQTFVDPRVDGGKLNGRTKEDIVELVELGGEELLFYRAFPIDVAIIRCTTADEQGNLSVEHEAANLNVLSAAQAAHNSGGVVIAQVKRLANHGSLRARDVKVPGCLVDAVVVNPDQWQTSAGFNNPSFSGEIRVPLTQIEPLAFDVRKVVARRAAMELRPGLMVNLGFGIADGVANIAAEEDLLSEITFSVEQGIVGGIPAKGDIFGAGYNPESIIDDPYQFDFYHGGGLDITFLGMAQADQQGNINVSKFGRNLPGCGGFIDISQNAREVVFCGTFTTGGLRTEITNGKLKIVQEGKVNKFVPAVEHITFSGNRARETGQTVLYVTERAVFELGDEGVILREIAPGVDLQRDILGRMDFRPHIPHPPRTMDPRIFQDALMNLRSAWDDVHVHGDRDASTRTRARARTRARGEG